MKLHRQMLIRRISTSLCVLSALWTIPSVADTLHPYKGNAPYALPPRTALVIGIPSIRPGEGFAPLSGPRRDAEAVAARLRELEFTVFSPNEDFEEDNQLTRKAIKQQIYDFAKVLKANKGVGVVYFSGHGLVDGEGRAYLVPYDASISFQRDLSEELIPVSLIYDAFEYAGNVLNVLVIDACRNNAFPSLQSFGGAFFNGKEPEVDWVYRVNATQTGNTAEDIDQEAKIGPYATAFIDALELADADLSQVFDRVNDRLTDLGVEQLPVNKRVGSRDFIFRPTVISFNREKTVFELGGARSVYENLHKQFAGGYFGKAALEYAKEAPLPPPPLGVAVAANEAQRLQTGPSSTYPSTAVVAGGTLFRVMGDATLAGKQQWLPVVSINGLEGFIDKGKTSPAQFHQTPPLWLKFEPDAAPGVEKLSAEALAAIDGLFGAQPLNRIIRANITVRRPSNEGVAAIPLQVLVARQAIVARVLADRGLAISHVERSFEDGQADEITAVRLALTIEEEP